MHLAKSDTPWSGALLHPWNRESRPVSRKCGCSREITAAGLVLDEQGETTAVALQVQIRVVLSEQ